MLVLFLFWSAFALGFGRRIFNPRTTGMCFLMFHYVREFRWHFLSMRASTAHTTRTSNMIELGMSIIVLLFQLGLWLRMLLLGLPRTDFSMRPVGDVIDSVRKTRVMLLAGSAAIVGMSLPSTTAIRLPSFGRVLKVVPQRGPYGLSLTGKSPQ